jgi:hypothetical protein
MIGSSRKSALLFCLGLALSPHVHAQGHHGLCIGIDDYPGEIDDLLYAEEDARELRLSLIQHQSWDADNIGLLLSADATKELIADRISSLPRSSGYTDWFSFAGHGEVSGLVTYDVKYLSPSEVQSAFGGSYNQYCVFLDACESGVFPDYMTHGVVSSACADTESASEYSFLEHGIYSYFLVLGLTNSGADINSDGLVSAEELHSWASPLTTACDTSADPQHPQTVDNYSGDLVLTATYLFVPSMYPTIAAAAADASWGSPVSSDNGTHTVGGDITICSGVTLDIADGSTLNATGNYLLMVEGKLTANNTTFTRSGGQWGGITFISGNAGSSLDYCTIQNAQYGVFIYNTQMSLSHCTFRYNTTGLYAVNYYGSISWSLFHDNGYGVRCGSYGDPDVSPNNIIRYNGRGVYAESGGIPNLGSYIGYNSLSCR